MVIANIPDDQVFAEAAQYWNLPQLYRDLAIANATDIYLINGKTILPQPQTGKSAIPITGSYGTDKF